MSPAALAAQHSVNTRFQPHGPHSWGEIRGIGGHPQTLGREESLHPPRISDLEICDIVKGASPPSAHPIDPNPLAPILGGRLGELGDTPKPSARASPALLSRHSRGGGNPDVGLAVQSGTHWHFLKFRYNSLAPISDLGFGFLTLRDTRRLPAGSIPHLFSDRLPVISSLLVGEGTGEGETPAHHRGGFFCTPPVMGVRSAT